MRARDNPFRSERIDGLAFRDDRTTLAALLDRWKAAGRRGALVGPNGSGKTTLLGELVRSLEAEGRRVVAVRLGSEQSRRDRAAACRALDACGPDDVACLDGFDLLPLWQRRRWVSRSRACHGALVTAHARCPLPTLHETRTSPELLAGLIAELLAEGPDTPMDLRIVARAERLYAQTRGNLREALFELYGEFAHDRTIHAAAFAMHARVRPQSLR